MKCPECNSKKMVKYGMKWGKRGADKKRRRVQQYRCNNCGRATIHPRG